MLIVFVLIIRTLSGISFLYPGKHPIASYWFFRKDSLRERIQPMENQSFTDVDRSGVLDLMKQGAQVVEVLSADAYRKAHIAGALNLPLGQIDRSTADRFSLDQPIVLYCYDYQ